MPAKLFRLIALAAACSLLLTAVCGCGKNEKENFVMRTYSTFGAENDLDAYAAIISEYTKKHKNVVINDMTTTRTNSYKMALSIASTYRGSNSPDVVYYSAMPDMSELSDFFMTVDDIRKDYPQFAANVSEAVLDSAAASDGRRYCIPIRGQWQGIVVNAAMLRKSALNIPTTWEDLVRAARHYSKSDVSLFANSLDESGALVEYMVRSLNGLPAVASAMSGSPDSSWRQALDAICFLDELAAFPAMPQESFDNLVSPSELKNTTTGETISPIDRYNSGNAVILLIDNTMCGSIDTDIDSLYIALPKVDTVTQADLTTAAHSYPTNVISGPVYPRITANTLPPKPDSGSGETTTASPSASATGTTGTTLPRRVSPSDSTDADKPAPENALYVRFDEGFYITKKAYYDNAKREDILDFVEYFLSEQNCVKLCGDYQAPSLSSMTKATEDSLTKKSNIYHAVIGAVQSADGFLATTQTQENRFFWEHCSLAVACMSKGILTEEEALRLIADTQITVNDIYKQRSANAR